MNPVACIAHALFGVQLGFLLLMTLFFLGIGALLLGDVSQWLVRGRLTRATVLGLSASGQFATTYKAIIQYRDLSGQPVTATSDAASNRLAGRVPGDTVFAFVREDAPGRCWLVGDGRLEATFGFVFFGAGVFLCYQLARQVHGDRGLWIIAALVATALLVRWATRGQRSGALVLLTAMARRDRLPAPVPRDVEAPAVMLDRREVLSRLLDQDQQQRGRDPLAAVIALVLIALGGWWLHAQAHLLLVGERARGTVSGFIRQQASGNSFYHARIAFRDASGLGREFTDRAAGSTPLKRGRDAIDVLYDPTHPDDARVDRGVWDLLIPAAPGAIGVLILSGVMSRRRQAIRYAADSTDLRSAPPRSLASHDASPI